MSNNPLTNQSYINKDFQTIYPELLELVKNLTYKWDPTISNESDPGVLLIKLNAIIADKNNYNIDKNILECFPDTVTQYDNAYKLFAQLGYNMHWYRSAKGDISFKWDSEPLKVEGITQSLTIPQFTMVSDNDKEIVYTTLQEVKLSTDGTSTEVPAIQGVVRDYTVGNNTLIKASMLDYRNRLYFPTQNVAENGIFISDSKKDGAGNYVFVWENPDMAVSNGWKNVENLYIQPLNTKCYKFGVDQSNNSCYIEFPNDVTDIMGDGLFIKYIQSDGALGNIAAKRISKFYEDLECTLSNVKVNISSNTKVTNSGAITNGLEPEEINDAYANYQKTIGTFNTLVTLRDYLNFIVNEEFEQVSNGVITDRTNDIQSSYEILTTRDNETTIKPVVDTCNGIPQMAAFDLKTYFLDYSQWPKFTSSTTIDEQKANFKKAYDKSFNLKLNNGAINELTTSDTIKNLYKQVKSIEHDFQPKLVNRPLLIKNKFKLNLTIIPNNIITQAQANDIEKTIYEALLKQLSSKNVNFGEEISYEQVYDICNNADNRVKAVALDNIEYTPYAVVYFNNLESSRNLDTNTRTLIFEDNTQEEVVLDNVSSFNDGGLNEIPIPTSVPWKEHWGETTVDNYNNLTFNEKIALEICAKNILAGVTPLYHPDDSFKYSLNQTDLYPIDNIERITTSNEIEFNNTQNTDFTYIKNSGSDHSDSRLFENESLFLYKPSLIDDITYSASIKYIYIIDNNYTGSDSAYIPANRDYTLSRGQHLFMFWKNEDSEDSPYLYSRYGEGTILKSTTRLIKYKDKEETLYNVISSSLLAADYSGEGQIYGELNDKLKEVSGTILSTNKNVTIKKINSVKLKDENNYCYWITNNLDSTKEKYQLPFKYVDPGNEIIDVSYQNNLIYVSNFDWSEGKTINNSKTLNESEEIIILRPINVNITYNAKNNSGEAYKATALYTNYEVVEKITQGKNIKCTGNLYKAKDKLYNDVKKHNIGEIILWGEFEPDPNDANYKIPKPGDIYKELSLNTQYILTNGYKIDVVKYFEKEFGTGAKGTSEFEYLLKANEMFIYTDDNKKSLYILENGTKITLTKPNSEIIIGEGKTQPDTLVFEVPIMDKNKIVEDGNKAFTDNMWYNFKCSYDEINKTLMQGQIITIIENEILSLGANTQLRVRQNPISVPQYVDNAYITATIYDERLSNLKIDSHGVKVAPLKGEGESIKDSEWVNIRGALTNYIIQYKPENEDSWINVPEVADPDLSWDGYTILNINSGANVPQYLNKSHNQSFNIHHINDSGLMAEIELPRETNTHYIQTSVAMNLQGGDNIDVTRINMDNEVIHLNALAYNTRDIANGDTIKNNGNGTYGITLKSPEIGNNNIRISIENLSINNDTLLALEFPQSIENVSKFDVTPNTDGEIIKVNNGPVIANKLIAGTYYYKLNNIESIEFEITYGDGDVKPNVEFIIKPLFKYNELLEDIDEDDKKVDLPILENEIIKWDKFHSNNQEIIQYDYIYRPLENIKINNPLNPKNYFNFNHKYNKFTIPQISDIKIQTVNKR